MSALTASVIDGWAVTDHARQRMHQRAVQAWMVSVALQWGWEKCRHGCVCYIVTDRALKNTPYERFSDRLHGLCVVVNPAEGVIVTVKWLTFLRRRRPKWRCRRPRRRH